MIQFPSPQRSRPIGWNASPKRSPQRPLIAPVWVNMVIDHWWAGGDGLHRARRRPARPRRCATARITAAWRADGGGGAGQVRRPRPAALQRLAGRLAGEVEVPARRPVDERARPPRGVRPREPEPADDGVHGARVGGPDAPVERHRGLGLAVEVEMTTSAQRNAASRSPSARCTDRLPASRYSWVALRRCPAPSVSHGPRRAGRRAVRPVRRGRRRRRSRRACRPQ